MWFIVADAEPWVWHSVWTVEVYYEKIILPFQNLCYYHPWISEYVAASDIETYIESSPFCVDLFLVIRVYIDI